MSNHDTALAHHFEDMEQQYEASSLGMWAFLITEVLFFGGLFAGYVVYRWSYPDAFNAGSHELDITLGAINTAVLIFSSLTMVMANASRGPSHVSPRHTALTHRVTYHLTRCVDAPCYLRRQTVSPFRLSLIRREQGGPYSL